MVTLWVPTLRNTGVLAVSLTPTSLIPGDYLKLGQYTPVPRFLVYCQFVIVSVVKKLERSGARIIRVYIVGIETYRREIETEKAV